jgi:AAA+ ATPase superfamily predicted ATPase
MFIGRQRELEFLESRYGQPQGQLVFLYGRRRVGKTETLHEFCKDKEHVFYSCTECTDERQLTSFSQRILAKDIPAARYIKIYSDWEQALKSVLDLPSTAKKLLVIDEFPYMVRNNTEIPSILQNLWDGEFKDANVMIVLCGSAMSFFEREILAEKNPLYGRATGILKMEPMEFLDAAKFFPDYPTLDRILAYSILGGIPHYLKQFDDQSSIVDNIKRAILQRGCILYNEVEFLMRQELRETAVYNTIVVAIALGNTKLNDIFNKTQINKSKLSVYLTNLIELGLVQREFPVSDGIKERANIQRGLYRITDNYFRFWYAFVFPNLSELEGGDIEGVFEDWVEPGLNEYASKVFEEICIEYLRDRNRRKSLPFRFTRIGRWWDKKDELDILAVDKERKKFLVGECKFRKQPFDASELDKLLQKAPSVLAGSEVSYFLFSKSGFTNEVKRRAAEKDIALIGLEEIMGTPR